MRSHIFIAWINAPETDEKFNGVMYPKWIDNSGQTLEAPYTNEVAFRFGYFPGYNQFTCKKTKA